MKSIVVLRKWPLAVIVLFCWLGCGLPPKQPVPVSAVPAVNKPTSEAYFCYVTANRFKNNGQLDRAVEFMKKAVKADPHTVYLKYELALLHLQQQDQGSASQVVEEILEKDDSQVDALMLLGRIKQGMKQMDEALQAYERVLEADPTRENVYVLLGKLYMDADALDDARRVYERLVAHFPDSYLGFFFLGKIDVRQGRNDDAEEKFKKTLELAPDLEEPQFELLKIYDALGREDEKLAIYNDMLADNPDNAEIIMELALFHYHHGKQANAMAMLGKLGERSLEDRNIIPGIARKYLETEKYDSAVIVLDGMLAGAPDYPELHYLAGLAKEGNGDKQAAVFHLRNVTPDSRFFQNAVVHAAFLYQELNQLEAAIQLLKDAISQTTPGPELLLYLGSFYEEIEAYDDAQSAFEQGLEIDPEDVRIHFRLGVTYDKQGQKALSIEEMKTVLRLDPAHTNALNYLGYTYAEMGIKLEEAEQLVRKALEKQPDDGYITDSLGWIYFKRGMIDQAITILEKAVSLVPDDPVILEHLGDAYRQIKNKEKAVEFYQRSLLKKKKDRKTLESLKALEKKIRELTEPVNEI